MKKMMKRIMLAGLACVAGAAILTGCGGGASGGASGGEKQFLNIATGGTSGTYYPLGGALAELLNNNIKGMNASAQATGAAVANINMLKDGSVDLAFVQNDIAYYAENGTEMFKDNKVDTIRGIAALYPETIQFVTTADTGITSVSQLKGKRVAVGASGSGSEANARQILAAYGITYDDIEPQYLSFGEAVDALKDGNVDAGVVVAGFPTAAIQDLSANKSAVVLDIDAATAAKLKEQYPYYNAITIPAGTYPGQETDVNTICVKCILIGTDKLSDDMGGEIAKILYSNLDRMTAAHAVGKYITKDTALEGMSIKMNAGAEKYLKS
jgi:TRAP transporter solute receptor, TAXI family